MKNKNLMIKFLGILFILSFSYKATALFDVQYYHYLHDELSAQMLVVRYIVSWVIKLTGIVCGLGLLEFKELFRKVSIGLWFFIVTTISFKHPLHGFELHTGLIVKKYRIQLPSDFEVYQLAFYSMIGARLFDGLVGIFVIWWLSRPHIKAQFSPLFSRKSN